MNEDEKNRKADPYMDTLMSMCLDFKIRRAITVETFVWNLRLFANCIEQDVIQKKDKQND